MTSFDYQEKQRKIRVMYTTFIYISVIITSYAAKNEKLYYNQSLNVKQQNASPTYQSYKTSQWIKLHRVTSTLAIIIIPIA